MEKKLYLHKANIVSHLEKKVEKVTLKIDFMGAYLKFKKFIHGQLMEWSFRVNQLVHLQPCNIVVIDHLVQ